MTQYVISITPGLMYHHIHVKAEAGDGDRAQVWSLQAPRDLNVSDTPVAHLHQACAFLEAHFWNALNGR